MTFHFSWFCELLEELNVQKHEGRATYARQDDPRDRIVSTWFTRYDDRVSRRGHGALALLSALFPERRSDRTYNLQERRLSAIFGRALVLGDTRRKVLNGWQRHNGPDFATCVEQVMVEAEFDTPAEAHQVTVEEIDVALTKIAANTIASAPQIRAEMNDQTPADILTPIIRRLRSSEAKWLVRMIMKCYTPAEIPEYAASHNFHFMLPKLLRIQNSFEAAVEVISRQDIAKLPARPSKEYETALLPFVFKEIEPQLGVTIQRQPLDKARSIKHCVKIANQRTISIERKYDGEYCQIHVDRSGKNSKIQIFAKSGRDATNDRLELLGPIKTGLRLGHPDCKIRHRAILEGELVVYSRAKKNILPFYHIRKHVKHGARRIGTEADSPKKAGEQLMVVFFDILLLDNRILANFPDSRRRQYLKSLILPVEGLSCIGERALINFASSNASQSLRVAFAAAIRQRWEGFVLKGTDDAYFSWQASTRGIKLKKDYILGLGDTIDLCIIGARHEGRAELDLNLGTLTSTHFYIACLTNKEDVVRFDGVPSFKILDCVGAGAVSNIAMHALNDEGKFLQRPFALTTEYMNIESNLRDLPPPTDMFIKPIIVEMTGAGFERPQSANFYVLRFPRGLKIHKDRGLGDTVEFDELQSMAERSMTQDRELGSQEDAIWIERLMTADPRSKYIVETSQNISPLRTPQSATTITISPGSLTKAATQPVISPVFIREDSIELTTGRSPEQYPSSCPQTPGKLEFTTDSAIRVKLTATAKRRLLAESESPLYGVEHKNKRARRNTTVVSYQNVHRSPLVENSNLVGESSMLKQTKMLSNEQAQGRPGLDEQDQPALENSGLVTPPSTEEAARTECTHRLSPKNSEDAVVSAPVLAPADVFANALGSIEQERCPHRLPGPAYVTGSALKAAELDGELSEKDDLCGLAITTSPDTFADGVMLARLTARHIPKIHIVFVDTEQVNAAVSELQRVARRLCSLSDADWRKAMVSQQILIFDCRILLHKIDFQVSQDQRELDMRVYEQWFCDALVPSEDAQGRPGYCLRELRADNGRDI